MTSQEQVRVTQADIAAAKAAQVDMLIGGAQGDKEVWRKVEQAFARHRQAAEAEAKAREADLVEALRQCVKVINDFRDVDNLAEGVHAGLRKGTDAPDAEHLWAAIAYSRTTAWKDAIAFAIDPYFTMWGGDEAIDLAEAAIAKAKGGAA